ncbi:Polysaccharide biosynthesis protein [uncultured archaeon]|nr:Polysaccharide biosynthesis protein [uncultured archaeon]
MKIFTLIDKIYADSILKNSMHLIVTNFLSLVLGFFFWMIATRFYLPKEIGIISAILSSMLLISTLSTIGLPSAMTFYLPIYSKDANKIINSSLIISIIISVIFSLIFLFGIDTWAPDLKPVLGNLELTVIFIIATIMTTVSLLMAGIFTAGKRSSFQMIKENVFNTIKIFLLVLFAGFGAIGIFISWSVGLIASMVIGFILLYKLWKYIPNSFNFPINSIIKDMAKFSFGVYIAGIFSNLPKLIFPILIVGMISADSAGYFFIAMTVAGILYGIPESMVGPFIAESSDKEKFEKNIIKTIRFNLLLLIPGLILVIFFGKFVLNIFNPNYANNSFATLIILSMASIPTSFVVMFNMINGAQKKIMKMIVINIITSLSIIILSIPLMKIWNIEGIAIAYLITNTIMAVFIIFKTKNPMRLAIGSKGHIIKVDEIKEIDVRN